MMSRLFQLLPCLGEMDRLKGEAAIAFHKARGSQGIERLIRKLLQDPINNAAKQPLRNTLGSRINRGDPAKVNRRFSIVRLDDFKLRVIEAQALAP